MESTPFIAYDMALLYNSRLFSEKINYILGLDISGNKNKDDCKNPCGALTVSEEEKIDIEQSRRLIIKLQNLLDDTIDTIIEKLNDKKYSYQKENKYFYDEKNTKNISKDKSIYCGRWIDINNREKCMCLGFFPTVFNEETNPKEVSDYFLSVAIHKDYAKVNKDGSFPLYGKGSINNKEKDWVFFPICRKTLCVDNYKECFSNKVVYIIQQCLDMNKDI